MDFADFVERDTGWRVVFLWGEEDSVCFSDLGFWAPRSLIGGIATIFVSRSLQRVPKFSILVS